MQMQNKHTAAIVAHIKPIASSEELSPLPPPNTPPPPAEALASTLHVKKHAMRSNRKEKCLIVEEALGGPQNLTRQKR